MITKYCKEKLQFLSCTHSDAIWKIRLKRLEEKVLSQWNKFSIWNAGKLGRRLYRSLSQASKDKVTCLCDVDKKKILQKSYHPYPLPIKVPILHVKDAASPFVICVKTVSIFIAILVGLIFNNPMCIEIDVIIFTYRISHLMKTEILGND